MFFLRKTKLLKVFADKTKRTSVDKKIHMYMKKGFI